VAQEVDVDLTSQVRSKYISFLMIDGFPNKDMRLEFSKLFNRIPNSETISSQPATDPGTNDDDCIGIVCWLTGKRSGTRNSKFDFAKLSCLRNELVIEKSDQNPSGGSSEETWGLGSNPYFTTMRTTLIVITFICVPLFVLRTTKTHLIVHLY
jgi:hypothetical protein